MNNIRADAIRRSVKVILAWNAHTSLAELIATEIEDAVRKVSGACPCLHITPCDPDCTCVNPYMSRGCNRCCTYGSPEQQVEAAKRLAGIT